MLFLIFLTLKLTGQIAWSWWWVAAPLFIPAVGVVVSKALLFLARPRTPQEKIAAACQRYAEAIRRESRRR